MEGVSPPNIKLWLINVEGIERVLALTRVVSLSKIIMWLLPSLNDTTVQIVLKGQAAKAIPTSQAETWAPTYTGTASQA